VRWRGTTGQVVGTTVVGQLVKFIHDVD